MSLVGDEHKETLLKLLTEMVPKIEPLPNEEQAKTITEYMEKAYLLGIMWGVKSSLNSIKEGMMQSCFQMEEFSKHLETHKL